MHVHALFFSPLVRFPGYVKSHTTDRALSYTPSKVSEVAPGSGVYPPFPQEKDPYLEARTHEMIQLFDLCHVLPFYSASRRWGGGFLTASAFTQFYTRLFNFGSRSVIDLLSNRVCIRSVPKERGPSAIGNNVVHDRN